MMTSPSSNYNYGRESEWLTQEIASIRFLADFAFANPTYQKAGLPREFADLLVAVGETLLVFQVKSHLARPQSVYDHDRMHRKIMKAFRQFRVMIEAISDQELTALRNSRGLAVPFDLKSFKEIFFIIIIHYIQEADAPPLTIRSSGFNDATMPINTRVFEDDHNQQRARASWVMRRSLLVGVAATSVACLCIAHCISGHAPRSLIRGVRCREAKRIRA